MFVGGRSAQRNAQRAERRPGTLAVSWGKSKPFRARLKRHAGWVQIGPLRLAWVPEEFDEIVDAWTDQTCSLESLVENRLGEHGVLN